MQQPDELNLNIYEQWNYEEYGLQTNQGIEII
jgi:hypothetical protein